MSATAISEFFTSADEDPRYYGASSDQGSFSLNTTAFSLSTAGAIVFIFGFMVACDARDATKESKALHFPANIFVGKPSGSNNPSGTSDTSTFKYIRNIGVTMMAVGAILLASAKIPLSGSNGKALFVLITYLIAVPLTLAFTAFATQYHPNDPGLQNGTGWVAFLVLIITGSMTGMSVMFSMDPEDPHKKFDGSKMGITISASVLMVVSVIGIHAFRYTSNLSMFSLFVPLFVISWLMFVVGVSLD